MCWGDGIGQEERPQKKGGFRHASPAFLQRLGDSELCGQVFQSTSLSSFLSSSPTTLTSDSLLSNI